MKRQPKLQSNIWKFGLYLVTNKRTYMSIIGVYLLTVPGTTPQTIGLMLLIGNLTSFVFEIPSGYLSDKFGHKNALILGRACLLLSTFFFLIGDQVLMFILGQLFLGIGLAFESGTSTAFMHETITALGRQDEYSKIMGKLRAIGFGVPIALIMLVPFLVNISYKLPFVVGLVIDIISLIATISLVSPPKSQEQVKEIKLGTFAKAAREGWRLGYFKFAGFSAFIAGIITASSNFKDVYQAALGVPVIYFGIFWGLSRVIVSVFLLFNHQIRQALTHLQFLFLKFLLASILIIGLSVFRQPWLIVLTFILIAALNWSFAEVGYDYILQIIKGSQFKATLLSIGAEFGTLINALAAFAIGYLAARHTYPQTFGFIGLVFVGVGILAYGLLYARAKKAEALTRI